MASATSPCHWQAALPSVAAVDHEPNRLLRALASLVVRRAVWVLALWLVVAGVVNVAVPQLEEVVADDSTPVVPLDSDSSQAVSLMDREFGSGRSHSFLVVLAEREGGLTRADVRYVEGLVPRLRQDADNVSFVQDIRDDRVREALTSDDGEAVYLQVGIPGFTGAPSAIHQVEHVREVVRDGAPDGLDVLVTGPSATVSDMAVEAESSILVITIVTIGLIFALLLLIYRRLSVCADHPRHRRSLPRRRARPHRLDGPARRLRRLHLHRLLPHRDRAGRRHRLRDLPGQPLPRAAPPRRRPPHRRVVRRWAGLRGDHRLRADRRAGQRLHARRRARRLHDDRPGHRGQRDRDAARLHHAAPGDARAARPAGPVRAASGQHRRGRLGPAGGPGRAPSGPHGAGRPRATRGTGRADAGDGAVLRHPRHPAGGHREQPRLRGTGPALPGQRGAAGVRPGQQRPRHAQRPGPGHARAGRRGGRAHPGGRAGPLGHPSRRRGDRPGPGVLPGRSHRPEAATGRRRRRLGHRGSPHAGRRLRAGRRGGRGAGRRGRPGGRGAPACSSPRWRSSARD